MDVISLTRKAYYRATMKKHPTPSLLRIVRRDKCFRTATFIKCGEWVYLITSLMM